MVDDIYKVLVDNLFEGTEMQASSVGRQFDDDFGGIIVAVTGGVLRSCRKRRMFCFSEKLSFQSLWVAAKVEFFA